MLPDRQVFKQNLSNHANQSMQAVTRLILKGGISMKRFKNIVFVIIPDDVCCSGLCADDMSSIPVRGHR